MQEFCQLSEAIGVDLGTSNICFGHYRNNKVELIPDDNGNYLIPSMVTYTDEEGEVLVGLVAQEHAHIFPETTVFESKRFIGLKYCDKNVQNAIIKYPYVVVNEHEDPTVKIRDRRISFEEIYIHMLKNVHEIARERLQKNVNVAVITVPAYFGENQRKATKMAAIKAGFKTVHLINEPTAAAIAYQHRNKTKYSRTLLIYDFGGGTFDTSIVKAKGLDILVLAIDGDCHLGGTDIDFNLQKHVKEDIEQSHRSFTVNKVLDRRIKCISKQNKEQLSRAKKCTFNLPDVHRDLSEYQLAITRKEFEDINEALFAKTLDIVKRCISGAKLNNSEIDAVVLVGGCSRIPKIKQLLADYFGIEKICSNENPDHLVAQGAVIYSNALGGDKSELKLLDVLSRSLGVECLGDKFVKMIKKNSPIPYQITKRYCTSQDNQKVAAINLYEGERSRASNNTLLRKYSINMVTMGRKGEILIDVTFSLNNEGILKIDADEVNTDNKNTLFVDITTKN